MALSGTFAGFGQAAEPLQGAAAVLATLAKGKDSAQAEKPDGEAAKLKQEIQDFKAVVATLTPEVAAKRWLELAERASVAKPEKAAVPGSYNRSNSLLKEAMLALPGPAVWPELRRQIEARPEATDENRVKELGLRFIAHRLVNDREALMKDLAALEAVVKAEGEDAFTTASLLQIMAISLQKGSPAEQQIKAFEKELEQAEADPDSGGYMSVPDLVALAGEEKARPLLRRALLAPRPVVPDSGLATIRLARAIALESVNELKAPVWELANSVEAWELFEALDKKYPRKNVETNATEAAASDDLANLITSKISAPDHRDYERVAAESYYVLALILQGRSQEAVKIVQGSNKRGFSLPYDGMQQLSEAGYSPKVFDFLYELLSQHPEVSMWQELISTAAAANQGEKPIALIQSTLAKTNLPTKVRIGLQSQQYRALLAADQTEAGIKAMRQILGAPSESTDEADEADEPGLVPAQQKNSADQPSAALQLTQLGLVLNRPELVEEGLKLTAAAFKKDSFWRSEYEAKWQATTYLDILMDLGRYSEAENALVELMSKKSESDFNRYGSEPDDSWLTELATVYHRAGRHADVLVLLDQAPQWGAKDILTLNVSSRGYSHHGVERFPLPYITATALVHENRRAEALQILEAMLDAGSSHDPAFELYLSLAGTNAPAYFDLLYQRDQFQERPLIWKAQYLKNAGKLAEAEVAARLAISIDPSDGEQKHGQRMRVYTVLAEIKEAGGDAEQARFFREVVQAIRVSENADGFYQAGLLQRGVEMYQEALKHFADAYCIQSRLAIQLAQLGLHEMAEAHYRKAFELMPDSFGRVETHCFGCEGAFNGQQAQGIAEKVFTELTAQNPTKPQLHYLLGYLRMEQSRYAEAMASFRQAVELDPLYLNAWLKIMEVDTYVSLSPSEKDTAMLALLRLDPLQRHSHMSYSSGRWGSGAVNDLTALWNTVEATRKLVPPARQGLYPLAASAKALAEQPKNTRSRSHHGYDLDAEENRSSIGKTPAHYLIADQILTSATQLVSASENDFTGYGF